MSDVIEPTAIIGPDGALRTGWELPEQVIFAYDFGANPDVAGLLRFHLYGSSVRLSNSVIGIMGTAV